MLLAAAPASEQAVRLPSPRPSSVDLRAAVEHDRRARTERVIELGRWIVLVYAAATANLASAPQRGFDDVNLLLAGWGLFNLAVTLSLVAGHVPGRRTRWAMTALDMAIATELVWMTGGLRSSLGPTFYAVIVASSLRYGVRGSVLWALVAAGLNVAVGGVVDGGLHRELVDVYVSRLALYLLIALTSALVARELIAARARQLAHTYDLQHAALLELREVDRLKSEFIMLASHELRTPLAKIKGWLALMQETGHRLPVEAQREGLEVLRAETEHLARLTDNLLCIAQLEAGEIRLRTGPVNLGQVFEQVAARFVESADRQRLHVDVAPDAAVVLADRERLALALACLVDNALKFSPEAEPVRLVARRTPGEVRIEVRDHGRPIPPEQRQRVFASFYQVESPLTRQRGGCGIGLYLARQLVERMGGRIWVDDRPGRGNTFVVTLPAEG